jgi:cold shock CspA family protein
MKVGQIVRYNAARGFGFIRAFEAPVHTSDHFFHIGDVENRMSLQVNDIVVFDTVPSTRKMGREDAVNVRLQRDEVSPAPAPEVL